MGFPVFFFFVFPSSSGCCCCCVHSAPAAIPSTILDEIDRKLMTIKLYSRRVCIELNKNL
jgi:hypothetical protein